MAIRFEDLLHGHNFGIFSLLVAQLVGVNHIRFLQQSLHSFLSRLPHLQSDQTVVEVDFGAEVDCLFVKVVDSLSHVDDEIFVMHLETLQTNLVIVKCIQLLTHILLSLLQLRLLLQVSVFEILTCFPFIGFKSASYLCKLNFQFILNYLSVVRLHVSQKANHLCQLHFALLVQVFRV